jgi:hypothetical protein
MKPAIIAAFLAALTFIAACTSLSETKGPFARATKGAVTQTDATMDDSQQEEVSPYPQQSPFGN